MMSIILKCKKVFDIYTINNYLSLSIKNDIAITFIDLFCILMLDVMVSFKIYLYHA